MSPINSTEAPQQAIRQPRILLIEDEPLIAAATRRSLERAGMEMEWAATGAAAIEAAMARPPDIVLIDLELPDTSGTKLIHWFKQNLWCGIIIVTANTGEAERIISLEIGADDYITKPPSVRELIARIGALHRRVSNSAERAPIDGGGPNRRHGEAQRVVFMLEDITVDLRQRRALDASGRNIDVTAAEFAVLEALASADGETVSREALSLIALRRPWRAEDRSIDQLVFLLRLKLTPNDRKHLIIQSVRGSGYRLVLPA